MPERAKDVLAGLFAADHLGQLKSETTTRQMLAARDLLTQDLPQDQVLTAGDLLDFAFARLVREYPVEYVFKSCALERILFGRHSPRTTAFYTEFCVGDSRADLLIVNGRAHIYEIKTRYDDLTRLAAQLDDYYRAFTYVTLFVDEALVDDVAAFVPEQTGIATLGRNLSIRTFRAAREHTSNLEHRQLFRLLHQPEYSSILRRHGIEPDSVDPAQRYFYCLENMASVEIEELYRETVAALKHRQKTVKLAELSASLPRSLMLAPFAYRMTLTDWRCLTDQMGVPV